MSVVFRSRVGASSLSGAGCLALFGLPFLGSGILALIRGFHEVQSTSPDGSRQATSERMNGSLRQWCKRMTRLTYAFSKKVENLRASLALHFAYYNFYRVHSSLKVTPAMENGVTDHIWSIEELVAA